MNLWKIAFAHPRKTFLSNIKWSIYNSDALRTKIIDLGYDERVRAEAIIKEDWIKFL
jgi:16S rRNA A1518/A1519 N6-dimethyltransferase RsmA/KsgA/DIM1 with predicted DNA glycosylase/AP lyase activity